MLNLANEVMVNSTEFKKLFEKKFQVKVTCIYNPFNKFFIRKDKIHLSWYVHTRLQFTFWKCNDNKFWGFEHA